MKKSLLFIPLISALLLTSCGGVKDLKKGESVKTGKTTETMTNLTYIGKSADNTRNNYKLEYKLTSSYDQTMALGGLFYYTATFDDVSNNGGILLFDAYANYPDSVQPNGTVAISFTISGFPDWKRVVISYDDNENISYSFGILRSDYNL